ncbi:MAG: TolC family protein, partial [Bryobacteraceae bacterium]
MKIIFTALMLCLDLAAQGPAQPVRPASAPANIPSPGLFTTPSGQFQGSVAAGQASAAPISLSLQDAIDRGLKTNLGLLVRNTGSELAAAARRRALANLLPTVQGEISGTEQQINLAAFGFNFPGIPSINGPFGVNDARASFSESVYDRTALKNKLSASQTEKASQLSIADGRDLVVEAVASAYLRIIADQARVAATKTQVDTAQALYERARDRHQAGLSPAIDELRAQVELKTQQQVLIAQQNQMDEDKLSLARAIGLPLGQEFILSESVPFTALEGITPDEALHQAYESRSDYLSSQMQVRAAETAREAARGERFPTLAVDANYGAIGSSFANSHGTFAVTGSLKFNIFDSGRLASDVAQADAVVAQRRAETEDLRGQIDFQFRAALLALKTAAA